MKNLIFLIPFIVLIGCKTEDEIINPCKDLKQVSYGGIVYNTVEIGSQCWMKENLNIGTKINSDSAVGYQQKNNGITEKYCFDNDTSLCAIYGGLYEWGEAMLYETTEGAQGICPNGWHIPTDKEWCTLAQYLDENSICGKYDFRSSIVAGGMLKEEGTEHWRSPNEGATNSSGFTVLPGGIRDGNSGGFGELSLGYWGEFWTSSQETEDYLAYSWGLQNSFAYLNHMYECEAHGISVRCLKDH